MTPSLAERAKHGLFGLLERIGSVRNRTPAGSFLAGPQAPGAPALWVFVSTIGELNAIDPFLREIVSRLHPLGVVLITDRAQYRDAYLARHPDAAVFLTHGAWSDAARLATRCPPAYLVVAEIPCWPGDAPCRFPYSFNFEALRRGAPLFLVNAWIYGYRPSCRQDALERRLFQRHYLRSFSAIGAQNEATRRALIDAGADREFVTVTGNIKFDAMQRADWSPGNAKRSPVLLSDLVNSTRPIVVAGCVTEHDEQEKVIWAFGKLRADHPRALLLVAPRHPEVTDRMIALRGRLAQAGLPTAFRSTLPDAPLPPDVACLVLDTMGELRDFYAAATIAHVGMDHNVLEPLAFLKPVTVSPGWNPTYPSYPVYRLLHDSGVLREAADGPALDAHWRTLLDDREGYRALAARIDQALNAQRGAVARHLDTLAPWIPAPVVPSGQTG